MKLKRHWLWSPLNSIPLFLILDAIPVETSVLMATSVECMIGSKPKSLINFYFMMCIIADIWRFVEWFLRILLLLLIHRK